MDISSYAQASASAAACESLLGSPSPVSSLVMPLTDQPLHVPAVMVSEQGFTGAGKMKAKVTWRLEVTSFFLDHLLF